MTQAEMNREKLQKEVSDQLLKTMEEFKLAYISLRSTIESYEEVTNTSVNDLPGFVEDYPFEISFDELPIVRWVDSTYKKVTQQKFSVLNYNYVNTGGNTMVGVFEVWLPAEKRTVYALTNEEGCTLSVVDYIQNEIEVDHYDELMIENVDWGQLTGFEKYFELYRHCLNEYTKSDSKYFGYTRFLPYYLLSDELQKQIPEGYLDWIHGYGNGELETNGYEIIVSPDYVQAVDDEDGMLAIVKHFKQFHDSTAANEEYYSDDYVLSFAGRTVRLPFNADVWDAIDTALTTTIENW